MCQEGLETRKRALVLDSLAYLLKGRRVWVRELQPLQVPHRALWASRPQQLQSDLAIR